ncbi:hypothetical protein VB834_13295 [Limnoraphis robusta Tam1]|uniref:hypothetical protein n=1 Tax=Limnoraphis robusta TaxID=1118279 RepID=UPI002B20D2E6|nr:hypothetical protein [Limnoraphis robusta]MEA5540004.1 hypothetical protein [Limnoraphis robusta Tam1]
MSKGEEDTVNAENTDENNQEKDMSKDLEVDTKPTKAQSSENSTPTQIQVAHQAMIMPNRPIEESHLEVVGTIMGNRPIFKTESVSGISFVHSEDSVGAMANRPVAISHLQITSMTVNRPVASNEVDDPYALMGYLD